MKKDILIVLAILILLVALFGFADFHLARAVDSADRQMSSGHMESPDLAGYRNVSLRYAVIGESRLADALRDELDEALVAQIHIASAEALADAPNVADGPYLVVELTGEDSFITPIRGKASVEVQMFYSADGDTSWRLDADRVFEFTDANRGGIMAEGTVSLAHSAWGLFSWPGYRTMVADRLADEIAIGLNGVFEGID